MSLIINKADELKAEIAHEKAKIALNDRQIEDAEHRQGLRRQYGERLYNRLRQLEAQLEREDTVLVKPTGPCVELEADDGVIWDV